MSNIAIKVENLGKKYVINHENGNGDDNFREVVIGGAKKIVTSLNPFSKTSKSDEQSTTEDFWALNDVNFTIKKGDKVGIIGRNGAGKSTLLKVLSRITEPTTGKIHINGRIASLLEVGTGFHPELTGRENIYLNGAILGMSRKEIKEKFDEIVAFAEVEKFLDTPVKRYSSGMYVRLAFSVAAHLEPEILVVDEVLAVGDVEFQKKCLGKMGEVSEDGRTIIFVSHNMNAVRKLCNKGIVLSKGNVMFSGKIDQAVNQYESLVHSELSSLQSHGKYYESTRDVNEEFQILSIEMIDNMGRTKKSVKTFDELGFRIKLYSKNFIKKGSVAIFIKNMEGQTLLRLATRPDSTYDMEFFHGVNQIICQIAELPLSAGRYIFSVGLAVPMKEWLMPIQELFIFEVEPFDYHKSGFLLDEKTALVAIRYEWKDETIQDKNLE